MMLVRGTSRLRAGLRHCIHIAVPAAQRAEGETRGGDSPLVLFSRH
jgi:hypothetical protein